MESIYGPPPGARQPPRSSAPRPTPRWQQALQGLLLLIVGVAAFGLLVWLEAGGDDGDPLRRLEHIQLNLPSYEPISFDMPAFKPLQSAEIIPRSAILPAETSAPQRPLQTADIIPP